MKVYDIPIKAITPYKNNPRKNDKAVEYVANSIREFGFKVPLVIGTNYEIVCGHTRWKAAKVLGLETVPCIMADDLSDEQIRAFRLADNKTGEIAEWDFSALEQELDCIAPALFNMSEFGFAMDIGAEASEKSPDDIIDDIKDGGQEEKAPISVCARGQVWACGNHRLMCGDAANADDFERLMGGEKADMCFTDPPYGVAIGDKNAVLNAVGKGNHITQNILNDNIAISALYEILVKAMTNVRVNCKDDASYYVTAPSGGLLLMMMTMMENAGLEVRHNLIWRKNCATFTLGRLDYEYQHEMIMYTWTKSHHNYRNGEYRTTIWDFDKPIKCDLHPTMKPVALVANALLDGTVEGDIVVDAFDGSGTTMIAAEQLGRRAFLMELDPHYCDVIISRWEQFTGQTAVLEK